MERINRITTTTSARVLIECNMLRRSQLVVACCSIKAENTYRVATIRLLLKFQVTLDLRGSTRVFADAFTRTGAPVPRRTRRPALLVERKNHVDGGVDINRIAVEKRRLIAPLTHGLQRGLLQQRMTGHHFQRLNRAVLANDGVQTDRAGNAGLARKRRIDGLNTVDDTRGLHVATNAERTGQLGLRWGRRCAHTADDATKHAAHGATGDAAGDSTGHASGHVGLGVFLNNLDILGDDLGGHQLASVHQMRLRLDVDDLSYCGRRGRRWRGRRRRQHCSHHGLRERLGVNQRNQNQNKKKEALEHHRDHDRPRLVCLFGIGARNYHLFEHRSYLLPAESRRPETFSLPRALLSAAGPVPAAAPWPRQRFQATTSGAAIPKLEYVPTTIPTTRAKEKARSTWPPIRNRTSTVRKVRPLVKIVRESVWLMDLLTTSANDSLRSKRLFSRMRSKMTIVSFME